MTTHRHSTVILGAGLCGLSAAYHLEEAGDSNYLVLERNSGAGGLARTSTYQGFSFDHSIHILYSRDPYAADLICNKLLAGNIHKQSRRSYCHTCGVYTEYPYQLNNYGLPPAVIASNIMGLIEAREGSPGNAPPENFEAWIHQTYGRGIAENFMLPYNRKQWAWDLKDMNYDWIAERVPLPDLEDVILGALQPPKKRYGPNQEFWYPLEGGIEAIPRAFVSRLSPDRLCLNANVAGVNGARREILLADGRRIQYDRLISTVPLPSVVAMLGRAIPPAIEQSAAGLKRNAVHTVNIGLTGDDLATGQPMHWIYFPEETSIFHRISFPGSFSPWMVPPGCSSIQVEISESIHRPCDRGALVERTLQDLVTLGILKERDARPVSDGGRVRVAEVVTLDPAYIIYDLNHRENTQAIKNYLRQFGIVTRGRFGEWEYLNMDHAILRGKSAVEDALMVWAG